MPDPREIAYRAAVESTIHRLLAIGDSLRPGSQVMPEAIAPWSLLQRAQSLFVAILYLLGGPSDAAVRIVARSLADLVITIAWLRLDPDTHVRLYAAEQWRHELEVRQVLERRHGPNQDERTRHARETKEAVVAQARSLAIEKNVRGVTRRGPLLPSMRERANQLATQAASDAYGLMFTVWSEWNHTGSGSLAVEIEDGHVAFNEGAPRDDLGIRPLAAALYAFALAELSRWLDLGVEGECDALREELVSAEQRFVSGR